MMSINKIRRKLHKTNVILGDINAVKRGKIIQRIGRRIFGKLTGRLMRKIFK
jgi:hypothetical protein